MADLVITSRFQLSKDGLSFDSGTIRKEVSLTSGVHLVKTVIVGTSEEDVDLGDIALPAIVVMQLITEDVNVTYGPKISGPAIETAGKLTNDRPFAHIGLESGDTLRVIASAAGTKLQLFAFEAAS